MLPAAARRLSSPLRQTQGLARSIFHLLNIDLPAPHYSLLCRRARQLNISLAWPSAKPIKHLVFDASGLKVFGEGEWKVRTHGQDYHRAWRKLHLSIDADSQQIVTAVLTAPDSNSPVQTNPARVLNYVEFKMKMGKEQNAA